MISDPEDVINRGIMAGLKGEQILDELRRAGWSVVLTTTIAAPLRFDEWRKT